MIPRNLPIYKYEEEIIKNLRENNILIIESPTGSGKTTQLPVILYKAGFAKEGKIGVTQPRRLATVSIAYYISQNLKVKVGEEVGYKIRFEEVVSDVSKIKIMTDGVLLQELKKDPLLEEYDVIIIDEAHERSLNIDFILGLLKDILSKRSTIKIIISSATINTKVFSKYFNNAKIMSIEAKSYPTQIIYDKPENNSPKAMIEKIYSTVENIIKNKVAGDILIFLTGEREIKEVLKEIKKLNLKKDLILLPLYGKMSKDAQERIFKSTPKGMRKIIASTNIAETSITVDNIKIVIDSGRVKINSFNIKTKTYSLQETPISKASAIQRAGRAGRTSAGTCYRLYSREDFSNRDDFQREEIYRTDLSEVVIRMADLGIKKFKEFHFISKPREQALSVAISTLKNLEALDESNHLTEIGKYMLRFPLVPIHARAIVEAMLYYPDAIYFTTIGLSFLSTNSIFLIPQDEELEARRAHLKFRNKMGDLVSFLNIYREYLKSEERELFARENYLDRETLDEILNIQEQLEAIVREFGIPVNKNNNSENIEGYLKSMMRGLCEYICIKSGERTYKTAKARNIFIHPSALVQKESVKYFVAGEIVETSKRYARSIGVLKKEWIKERLSEEKRDEKKSEEKRERAEKKLNLKREKKKREPKQNSENFYMNGKLIKIENDGSREFISLSLSEMRALLNLNESELLKLSKFKVLLVENEKIIFNKKSFEEVLKIVKIMGSNFQVISSYKRENVKFEAEDLKLILKETLKITKAKTRKKNTLSFLALKTDQKEHCWLKPTKNFYTAVEESIYTLEYIIENEALFKDFNSLKGEIKRAYKQLRMFFS